MTASEKNIKSIGLEILLRWARGQRLWIQHLVREVLTGRIRLTDQQISNLTDTCLKELGLAEGAVPEVQLPSTSQSSTDGVTQLRLVSLKHIENVNALEPNQEIEFHPRLTICYGENGSGKSGYVRILKRASAVRTAAPVLPNIYSRGSARNPQARIKIALDDKEQIIDWFGEQGIEPLTDLNVFDSRIAVLHISEDLNYSYTPADLELFPLVTDGIQRVQEQFEKTRDEKRADVNPFKERFKDKSQIRANLESLDVSPNLGGLLTQADLSASEEVELTSLRDKVSEMRSQPLKSQIEAATQRKDIFERVSNIGAKILRFDQKAYNEAISALRTARLDHEKATKETLTGENVPGVLGDAWKEFVEAAEVYINDLKLSHYPETDSQCIYCRQPLDDAAIVLITKYRDYCNAALRQAVERAERDLRTICAPLGDVRLDETERDIGRLIASQKDSDDPQTALNDALAMVKHARVMYSATTSENDCPMTPDKIKVAIGTTRTSSQVAVKTFEDLRKEGIEREDALSKAESRLSELEERVLLKKLMPKIRDYVDLLNWVNSCDSYLQSFQSIKRGLTQAEKKASSDVLNSSFQKIFRSESDALLAPAINLDFPGRQGQSRRRKRLASEHELGEILSEGEQKIIALADFLAETTLRPDNYPIVFDDPVTSLDHLRMKYVVSRIAQLSQTRQVIVFTHDILFVAELLAQFERDPNGCSFYSVTAEDQKIGIVERGSHPRTDTFNDRKSRINVIIEKAGNTTGEHRRDLVERGYEELRGACEVFVEKDLLKGVTERYRPNVRMTVLDQIRSDRLPDAVAKILPIFDACSRNIASHSQPLASLGARPSLDDLIGHWKALQDVGKRYKEN